MSEEKVKQPRLRPLRGTIIGELLLPPDLKMSEGGIIEVEGSVRQPLIRVIAAGPGQVTSHGDPVPMDVKPGDICMLKQDGMAQGEFDWGPHRVFVYAEGDIAAVVEDPEPLVHERPPLRVEDARAINKQQLEQMKDRALQAKVDRLRHRAGVIPGRLK